MIASRTGKAFIAIGRVRRGTGFTSVLTLLFYAILHTQMGHALQTPYSSHRLRVRRFNQ